MPPVANNGVTGGAGGGGGGFRRPLLPVWGAVRSVAGMKSFGRVALVANFAKAQVPELAAELRGVAEQDGVAVVTHSEYPLPVGALAGCDLCVTLGGDGTLLGAVPEAAARDVPVLGINRGKLGFLANYPAENAAAEFRAVLRGEFQFSPRALLECADADDAGGSGAGAALAPAPALALNDVAVSAENRSGMSRLRVFHNGEFVNSFLCDGLVVATPTGSTAYNLSAGGPLIEPQADLFVLSPICPHTLSARPLLFQRGGVLRIEEELPGRGRLDIEVDGSRSQAVLPLEIRLSERRLRLVQPRGFSHFNLLRTKLRW